MLAANFSYIRRAMITAYDSKTLVWTRDYNGGRYAWVEGLLPAEEHREAGKALARHIQGMANFNHGGMFAIDCPFCQRGYDIPSTFINILETGLCHQCDQFSNGLRDAIELRRFPTFEEAYEHINDPRNVEVSVLLYELRRRVAEDKNGL